MTPTELKALRALAEKDWQTKSDLINKINTPRRTLYCAVKNLIKNGLVAVKPSLRDTRQKFFALTESGRLLVCVTESGHLLERRRLSMEA